MASGRKRLGELLVEAGVIDAAQLTSALAHQRQWGVRLGQALVELRIASEKDIVHALSRKLGIEVAVLDGLSGREFEAAMKLVPRDFATKHNLLPMADDGSVLTVAMSDPMNVVALDELSFRTGRKLKVTLGGDREVAAALRRHHGVTQAPVESIALDEDDGSTAIMALVGHEQSANEEADWRAPAPRPRRAAGAGDRGALLGSVPDGGFDVEKTAEVTLRPDFSPPAEEPVTEDILEPEALEEEPAPELPAPAAAPPAPEPEEPALPSRAAAAIAAVAARGSADPELADAARVLAAVIRVLVRKGLVSDRDVAEELRTFTPVPRKKG